MTDAACVALTRDARRRLRRHPVRALTVLSDASAPTRWVKDETGNVGGSHKGRHLVTILLHLRAAESLGLADGRVARWPSPRAATRRSPPPRWPAAPTGRSRCSCPSGPARTVLAQLECLGASRHPLPPPGRRPARRSAVLRFREAVAGGAVPFSVQGPENALCLDGGRTLGWELADAAADLDRVVVQVGGGALATCDGMGPRRRRSGSTPCRAEGVRAAGPGAGSDRRCSGRRVRSPALGRADDAVGRPALGRRRDPRRRDLRLARRVRRPAAPGGSPVVVPEAAIVAAHELAPDRHPRQRHRHRRPRRPADPDGARRPRRAGGRHLHRRRR